jgi:hypothetical protein
MVVSLLYHQFHVRNQKIVSHYESWCFPTKTYRNTPTGRYKIKNFLHCGLKHARMTACQKNYVLVVNHYAARMGIDLKIFITKKPQTKMFHYIHYQGCEI